MGFKPEDLIVPGASILSDGINAVVDGINNRAARRWQEKMMQWQRDANLTDMGLQNAYNSPAEQMKRLREAGLNPNLVYGNGVVQGQSAQIKGASAPSSSATRTNIDGGKAVMGFLNAKQMELQNDNLVAQNKVLTEQAKNIAADTTQKKFGADLKEFDFNYKTDTRNQSLYGLQQRNINAYRQGNLTQAQIANTQERTKTEVDTRQPRINAILQTTSESLQRIVNMRVQAAKSMAEISYIYTQVENAQKDGKLKDVDLKLRSMEQRLKSRGLTWSDPTYLRQMESLMSEIF